MAISKSFFGLRKRSTKSLTFSTYRGQQVTKDRVTKVSNPQSDAQMAQRLKLVIVSAYGARLKSIIDHSFEGVQNGYPSIAEFRKVNLSGSNLVAISYPPKGSAIPGIASIQVSRGQLLTPSISIDNSNVGALNLLDGVKMDCSKITTDSTKRIEHTEANAKLIADMFGIEVGQQLTLILQVSSPEWQASDDPASFQSQFIVSRIVTDINDSEFMAGWLTNKDTAGDLYNGYMYIYGADSGQEKTVQVATDLGIFPTPSLPSSWDLNSVYVVAGTAILSGKKDNVWLRSSSFINYDSSDRHLFTDYEDAYKTYLKAATKSKKYLNSGSDSVSIIGG